MSPARKRHRKKDAQEAPSADLPLSAAERFQAFRDQRRFDASERATFIDSLGFRPDSFQVEAMEALEEGESVLVAAPTGAGKTVVGEFATHLAVAHGRRAFYTTPIKALSNQKFADLKERFGEGAVGLLTGDTSINPGAPIVVMTTEVLRNMIYAGTDLSALAYVVLDEVHYLADKFRGPVWEEVIIHLPAHVAIVGLSATVSNAEEFGAWMREVRGSCRIIVSEKRPVPLYQHMIAGGELYDLYSPTKDGKASPGRLNPELLSAVFNGRGSRAVGGGRMRGRSTFARKGRDEANAQVARRFESRPAVAITLERAGLLPAIVFIFSRAGCEDAVRAMLASGIVLTSSTQARTIRQEVEAASALIPVEDHGVLGVDRWARALERGIAAHHAGMLPVMKETVEKLFTQGLVKIVYATETLALGINMPARTVVIESLQKWDGSAHVPLSAGEYTQLSGRAGRRGIDTEGHAVVLHKGKVAPEEVSALASKRTYPLISAFHPTYNMVVNLLSHSTRAVTREVLETSFAQYQADGAVVQLAQSAKHVKRTMDELAGTLECDRGDAGEYFALRDEISRKQKEAKREATLARRNEAARILHDARRGDVVSYRKGRKIQHAVVIDPIGANTRQYGVQVIGTDGRWHHMGVEDVAGGLTISGNIPVNPVQLRKAKERALIGATLRDLVSAGSLAVPGKQSDVADELSHLERALRQHPVHQCPQRESHAAAGHAWARQKREYERLMRSIDGRTNSVAKSFDKVCQVLETLGFLTGDTVTTEGEKLRRIFGERDLVIAQAIRKGAWAECAPAELAAIASAFVYEARTDDGTQIVPTSPDQRLLRAWDASLAAQMEVNDAEKKAGAQPTAPLEAGLMAPIYAWASGASLSTALEGSDLQGGDFVRWVRQACDLLDQLRFIGDVELEERAHKARDLIMRGVVAWSGV